MSAIELLAAFAVRRSVRAQVRRCRCTSYRFDVGRSPDPHTAFGGGGPHLCLGKHVARIEIAVVLREMLTRLPDMRPTGPIERMHSSFIAGTTKMPAAFTPGERG